LLAIDLVDALVFLRRLEVSMKDLVLVQPLGLEHFVVSNLIRVVTAQVRQNVISLGFCRQETVFILPVVLVHPKDIWLVTYFPLRLNIVKALNFLLVQEVIIAIWHPLVVLE